MIRPDPATLLVYTCVYIRTDSRWYILRLSPSAQVSFPTINQPYSDHINQAPQLARRSFDDMSGNQGSTGGGKPMTKADSERIQSTQVKHRQPIQSSPLTVVNRIRAARTCPQRALPLARKLPATRTAMFPAEMRVGRAASRRSDGGVVCEG